MAEVLIEIVTSGRKLELTGTWPQTLNTAKDVEHGDLSAGERASRRSHWRRVRCACARRLPRPSTGILPHASTTYLHPRHRRGVSGRRSRDARAASRTSRRCSPKGRSGSRTRSSARCTRRSSRSARRSAATSSTRGARSPGCGARSSSSCRENGLRIAAAGTHPISHWASVPITSNARYDQIVYDLQMVARANLIFGLHVHVAIEDLETRIQIMNAARYFLPHVFALSVNSPFWCGQNTGWKSYRAKVFERFPRTGIPDSFRVRQRVRRVRAAAHPDELHRQREEDLVGRPSASVLPDARVPHLRRADARRRDHLHRRALPGHHRQAVDALHAEHGLALYRRSLLNENKPRAARFGIDGKLIDFGKKEEVPFADLLDELLEFVDDVVDELGSREDGLLRAQIVAPRHRRGPPDCRSYEETNDLRDGGRLHHRRDGARRRSDETRCHDATSTRLTISSSTSA